MKRLFLETLIAGLALAAAGAATAQARGIRFATQNPRGHPITLGMARFAEIVAAKSGGKLEVKLFPGGVLGGDAQNVSALQGGTIDRVVLNAGILASRVKDFAVLALPFMFASPQEADTPSPRRWPSPRSMPAWRKRPSTARRTR